MKEEEGVGSSSPAGGGVVRLPSKVCLVCGDKAFGYNFNVISCESCKAFFRRNAVKEKEFRCPFTDSCLVTTVSRRFCQKCRLRKCFEVGMKKDWILSEEARLAKRSLVNQNRLKRQRKTVGLQQEQHDHQQEELVAAVVEESAAVGDESPGRFDFSSSPSPVPSMKREPNDLELSLASVDVVAEAQPAAGSPPAISATAPPTEQAFLGFYSATNTQRVLHQTEPSGAGSTASAPPFAAKVFRFGSAAGGSSSIRPTLLQMEEEEDDEEDEEEEEEEEQQVQNGHGCSCDCRCGFYAPGTPLVAALKERLALEVSSPSTPPHDIAGGDAPANNMASLFNMMFDSAVASSESPASGLSLSLESSLADALAPEHDDAAQQKVMTAEDQAKLEELYYATQALTEPIPDDYPMAVDELSSSEGIESVVAVIDLFVRRLIKMCKRLSAFASVCRQDQVALLKGGVTENSILRGAYLYDPVQNVWTDMSGGNRHVSLEILRLAKGTVYEEHKNFLRTFNPLLRKDEAINLILQAISLFNPHRPNLLNREAVQHEQQAYFTLLRHYLWSKFPAEEAKQHCCHLMKKMDELLTVNANAMRFYLNLPPNEVKPLLVEIFDLKRFSQPSSQPS